jgi:hypothetical protein
MSAYQPIDIKPLYGRKWVTNGVNNVNLKLTRMRMTTALQTAVSLTLFCKLCVWRGLVIKQQRRYTNVKRL